MPARPPVLPSDLARKYARVRERLAGLGSAVLAYSGGVDSTLVLAIGREALGEKLLAVTASSETYPPEELEDAAGCASELGVRHEIVQTRELEDEGFRANPAERCFLCKTELLRELDRVRRREGFAAVVEGTNADDAVSDRPGLKALAAAGVVSPLADAGLTKQDVRALSRALGLRTWDKPAMACLASRIPFGTPIDPARLAAVAGAERAIRALGFPQVRVRHHGDVARVEVPAEDIARAADQREAIASACARAGFVYTALDLVGYRAGSMDEALTGEPSS